ncbi:MAG: cobalamin biosynthesis protein [Lachnospiraceae bacterium]
MKILMLACSRQAYDLMQTLKTEWLQSEAEDEIITIVKCSGLQAVSTDKTLLEVVGEWFDRVDVMIFLCATGIAVRSIAPYIKHKSIDPAVLVIDEMGVFCISLLSGHTGGANHMVKKVAPMIGALPVITTASDIEGKFAVDEFARQKGLTITNWQLAKEIAVSTLEGAKIAKREIAIGIGCKKGTSEEKIEDAIRQCLLEEGIEQGEVFAVSSIDLKKEEQGLLSYCDKTGLLFLTYSVHTLQQTKGVFTSSEFVEQITGVSNVCERSAVEAAGGGKLLCHKHSYQGVTVALAEKKGMAE